MMAWPTIICGALLVMLGVIGYANATPNAETGTVSPTALIPAGIGGVLILCGLLAFNDKIRKHVMHAAAMVGLLGFVGGLSRIAVKMLNGESVDFSAPGPRNGLLTSLVCVVFVGLCVKSFIDARRARERTPTAPTAA